MTQSSTPLHLLHATANRPGAVAILQLLGDSSHALHELTGVTDWPIGALRLVKFGDIDEGLAVRLNDRVVQLMPHGGPRVVQRLTSALMNLGAAVIHDFAGIEPPAIYPEASDMVDAQTMLLLARAQSPLAVNLLLDQPHRWRTFKKMGGEWSDADQLRSQRLNRLIDPPIVVLAGRPNVGKSTLSNALLGRSMSIAFDLPGTTRDYTSARIDLAGLVVQWHDTPGIHATDDPIEANAIEVAARLIERADLLIAMADPQTDWPDLPRDPDLRVMNKADLAIELNRVDRDAALISAKTGDGIAELVINIRDALIHPDDLESDRPWLFSPEF